MCAKHHIPLVTRRGYTAASTYHWAYSEKDMPWWVALYPNRVPLRQSLKHTEVMALPLRVTYCPLCEAEYEQAASII